MFSKLTYSLNCFLDVITCADVDYNRSSFNGVLWGLGVRSPCFGGAWGFAPCTLGLIRIMSKEDQEVRG